jgi:hypothetical protein
MAACKPSLADSASLLSTIGLSGGWVLFLRRTNSIASVPKHDFVPALRFEKMLSALFTLLAVAFLAGQDSVPNVIASIKGTTVKVVHVSVTMYAIN